MPGEHNQPSPEAEEPEGAAEAVKRLSDVIQEVKDKHPDLVPSEEAISKIEQSKEAHKHADQLFDVMKMVKRKIYLDDNTLGWNEVEEAVNDVLFNIMGKAYEHWCEDHKEKY